MKEVDIYKIPLYYISCDNVNCKKKVFFFPIDVNNYDYK